MGYASCMANNGQNMAGLSANSVFYNLTTAVAMVAGHFGLAALALVLAGRFARQGRKSETIGTLPNDTLTFGGAGVGDGAAGRGIVLSARGGRVGPIADQLKMVGGG